MCTLVLAIRVTSGSETHYYLGQQVIQVSSCDQVSMLILIYPVEKERVNILNCRFRVFWALPLRSLARCVSPKMPQLPFSFPNPHTGPTLIDA